MKTLHLKDPDNIWFISDTHFQHANIIEYCNRPFKSRDEMDSTLIKNWNSVVPRNGIVFHLGDFCFGDQKSWIYLLDALNGEKHLIAGNHDKSITPSKFAEVVYGFRNIMVEDEEIKDGQRITLCHYPMLSWYQSHRGSWQLFGHVHGDLYNDSLANDGFDLRGKLMPTQLDMSVEVHNYTPVSYQQVKTIITKQCIKARK
jgi:calcineurin-like phosphoesterase family protein